MDGGSPRAHGPREKADGLHRRTRRSAPPPSAKAGAARRAHQVREERGGGRRGEHLARRRLPPRGAARRSRMAGGRDRPPGGQDGLGKRARPLAPPDPPGRRRRIPFLPGTLGIGTKSVSREARKSSSNPSTLRGKRFFRRPRGGIYSSSAICDGADTGSTWSESAAMVAWRIFSGGVRTSQTRPRAWKRRIR